MSAPTQADTALVHPVSAPMYGSRGVVFAIGGTARAVPVRGEGTAVDPPDSLNTEGANDGERDDV